MSVAARNILLHQVETMTHSLCAGISESLFNAPSDGHTDATVHESVIQVSVCIDSLVTGCCVFLTEPLPQPPKYASLDKETNRRQSNATAPGRGKQSVQLDIERVFAQEIQIFDPEAICSGTVEGLVAAVLKPILKCVGESLRMGNLDTGAYKNANADVTYLKQVGNMFLKQAVVDTDRLAEQVSMIVFSRYIFSNDIAKSSDHFESMQVSRAVREALVITAKKAVFFPR